MPTHATDIAGYTYNTETLCPRCTLAALVQNDDLPPANQISVEATLDMLAVEAGINRYDEREYDSSDFPKVVFTSQLDSYVSGRDPFTGNEIVHVETCDHCGKEL